MRAAELVRRPDRAVTQVRDRTRLFLFLFLSLSAGVLFRVRAGRLSERDQSAVGLPLLLNCNGCRRQWRRMFEVTPSRSAGVASFRRQVEAKPRAVNGALWLHAERASQPWPPSLSYTGHFSSFHAISQNIHSYRELATNDSSIRRFSSLPAVLAH